MNKQTNVPFLKNKFVFLLPEVFEVRTEFMPNTEERMWGHLLLTHFWFHTEIGCSFQKAVKEIAEIANASVLTDVIFFYLTLT